MIIKMDKTNNDYIREVKRSRDVKFIYVIQLDV